VTQSDFKKDFNILTESLPQIFWICTPDGKNVYFNQLWADYTGLSLEESHGHGWNKPFHPDDQQKAWDAWQNAVTHGAIYSLECRLRRADGVYRWWHIRGVPVMDELGAVTRWFGTCTDINELKEALESLRKSEEYLEQKVKERTAELEELNRSLEARIAQGVEELRQKDQLLLHDRFAVIGETIHNIAHQWRQPLNTLSIVIQDVQFCHNKDQFSPEFIKAYIDESMELIQFMSITIDDFMNFFRIDKKVVTFSIIQVVSRTLNLIERTFKEQNIGVTCGLDGDPVANGFPNEYSHALLNILMNARDALVSNCVNDALISIDIFSDGGTSVVTVTDNGGGVPDAIIDRLFDPYFTTKGPDKGTGIGLFMSKTIIEKNMGGKLTVRNVESGAQFRIEV